MKENYCTVDTTETCIDVCDLAVNFDEEKVLKNISLSLPKNKFTVVIGPNGCGKSTMLRSLNRLIKPTSGEVLLDGKQLHSLSTKQIAQRLGLLPQSPLVPEGLTVYELVSRGRFPHQNFLQPWSLQDQNAVEAAIKATHLEELASRVVDQLSGGQRQRVWVATILAQDTPYILLDEPTTYLDIAHQIELLDLFRKLNLEQGKTLVAVLHDLNHACRYADHLVVMAEGKIIAQGIPEKVVTSELVEQVFGLQCHIIADPVTNTPLIIPRPPA